MTEMLVHELCHVARWGKNDEWMNTLFDGVINEGIATYFEAEFVKDCKKSCFSSKQCLSDLIKKMKKTRKIARPIRI